MLSASTLLALGALWTAVLLPRAVRDVRSSPVATVTGFNDAMTRLAMADQRLLVVPGEGSGVTVVHPRTVSRVALLRRRRALLVRLLLGTAVTLVAATVVGGAVLWSLAAAAGVALAGYCVALRTIARRRELAKAVVRLHPTTRARPRRDDGGADAPRRAVAATPATTAPAASDAAAPPAPGSHDDDLLWDPAMRAPALAEQR